MLVRLLILYVHVKTEGALHYITSFIAINAVITKNVWTREKLTNLKKFNSISYTGTDEYKERKKETCLSRYGVENPAQCPAVRSKMKRSAFATKKYTFPSGVIVDIQGYEHYALDELLKTYDEAELLTDDEDQPEIWWTDSRGKRHRYFSDIYIPSAKKVIEVKSTYTAALHPEKLARCGGDSRLRV